MEPSELAKLRREYSLASLCETEMDADPMRQFAHWFAQALAAQVPEANAMALATVGKNGRPSVRIVLLKESGPNGLVFVTDYRSRKGCELAHLPYASVVFYWMALERQVRIEGKVEKTDAAYNDAYFAARPLASKIGAWAAQPGTVVASRSEIDARMAEFTARFGNNPPRPPEWGGYRIIPDTLEFWQGRAARVHDRIQYQRTSKGGWRMMRLG
jgi:pyridoxamine 5'-phosphate oxidase